VEHPAFAEQGEVFEAEGKPYLPTFSDDKGLAEDIAFLAGMPNPYNSATTDNL
jgi:hypothetical protein